MSDDIEARVKEIFAMYSGVYNFADKMDIPYSTFEVPVDGLDFVEITMAVEQQFGFTMSDDLAIEIFDEGKGTLAKLIAAVKQGIADQERSPATSRSLNRACNRHSLYANRGGSTHRGYYAGARHMVFVL
jgi:acyl carrier protein